MCRDVYYPTKISKNSDIKIKRNENVARKPKHRSDNALSQNGRRGSQAGGYSPVLHKISYQKEKSPQTKK